ncbi:hypothetical protein [Providencia alcalifaciens]|uniref:hypothetical protein n=1 Tax=Providencia alcalifaciens TaxID=126385 RepID=UPI001CC7F771|nr:hypothetical protein [Providencia alcalifaciens]CAG9421958.1 hypothetical protein NVI2019_GHJFPKLH_02093 [Providencia alcalifaciens]
MEKLSNLINLKQETFSQHPFFLGSIDSSLPVKESLAFLPKLAFFILAFGDINKYILPFENPKNDLEAAVNDHALEDSDHWYWYIDDLRTLRMNEPQLLTDTLVWLWSPQMEDNRKLIYELISAIANQPAKIRLAVIECMEATGRTFFTYVNQIAKLSPVPLKYCGALHLAHESGHTMGSDAELIDTINYTDEEHVLCVHLIERIFTAFTRFIDEINQ